MANFFGAGEAGMDGASDGGNSFLDAYHIGGNTNVLLIPTYSVYCSNNVDTLLYRHLHN